MPYYGFVEVEVRLVRQGHGPEGEEFGVVATRTLKMDEADAHRHVESGSGLRAETDKIRNAIKDVLDEDEMIGLRDRWRAATASENLTPTKLRAALEVLEAHG